MVLKLVVQRMFYEGLFHLAAKANAQRPHTRSRETLDKIIDRNVGVGADEERVRDFKVDLTCSQHVP